MNPEHHALKNTSWQLFATLTFKREEMSEAKRVKLFFAFARKTARWFRVHFPRLKWALRLEHGEQTGRLHFHALIAGLPQNAVTITTCHALEKLWEHSLGVGIAKVREWEAGRDAVSYILKEGSSVAGANVYESRKFGSSRCMVMLSKSILSVRNGHRTRRAQNGDEGRRGPHHEPSTKG